MPYRIDWEPSLAIVSVYGKSHANEAVRATTQWQADERFSGLRHVIYDLSGAQNIEPLDSSSTLEIAVNSIGANCTNPRIQIGVIQPVNALSPAMQSSVSGIVALTGGIYPIHLFHDRELAYRWTKGESVGIQADATAISTVFVNR